MHDGSDFDLDFERYPNTATLTVFQQDLPPTEDWESGRFDRPATADDPLTATFSDLDLAPAREELRHSAEWDADYWSE
jgi:hypothetical protein